MGDGVEANAEQTTGCVSVGRFVLHVGNPAGTAIELSSEKADVRALTRAIKKSEKDGGQSRSIPEALTGVTDEGSRVTGKIERTITLCTEVAAGRLDLASIADEIDALRGLAQWLDKTGRHKELLELARCLSVLLSLVRRWMALLSLLRTSHAVAKRVKDPNAEGWALHELGTLHMAAGRHARADDLLTEARTVRERCGDRRGAAVTDRNLQTLCRMLRHFLHEPEHGRMFDRLARTPALAVLAAVTLLTVGGTAGAVLGHRRDSHPTAVSAGGGKTGEGGKGGKKPTGGKGSGKEERSHKGKGPTGGGPSPFKAHPAEVDFSFEPASPRTQEGVVFHAMTSDSSDPVIYYEWRFVKLGMSNFDTSHDAGPKYVFAEPDTYEVTLIVSDSHHISTGSKTRQVKVESAPTQHATNTLGCSPESVAPRRTVTIEGSITPAHEGVNVTITYTPEESSEGASPKSKTVTTNGSGHYADKFSTAFTGSWHASSTWSSEPDNPVISNSCAFVVTLG